MICIRSASRFRGDHRGVESARFGARIVRLLSVLLFFVLTVACGGARAPAPVVESVPPAPPPAEVLYAQAMRHQQLREIPQMRVNLEGAAEQGHRKSQYLLCVFYANDIKDLNYQRGLHWCQRAAEQGEPDALRMVGVHFAQGMGVTPNHATAVEWMHKAIEKGSVEAMFDLGSWYQLGDGVEQDVAQAMDWYRRAAEKGYGPATQALRKLESRGVDLTKLDSKPLPGLQEARAGDPEAQFRVGMLFLTGGKRVDRNAHVALFFLARARHGGQAMATRLLERYEEKEVFSEGESGLRLLQIAAMEGHLDAAYALGAAHVKGLPDIPQNVSIGEQWLVYAADKGHAMAAYDLAVHDLKKLRTVALTKSRIPPSADRKQLTETYEHAKKYLQKAVDLGEPLGWFGLGSLMLWEFGEEDAAKMRQVAELDRRAAEQGVMLAKVRLISFYFRGQGVPRDFSKAVKLLEEILIWGGDNPHIFAYYGEALLRGVGTPANPERGIEYLERAARGGVAHACVILTKHYRARGDPESLKKALDWEEQGKRLRARQAG